MLHLIDKDAVVAEIEKLKASEPYYPTLAEKDAYKNGVEDAIDKLYSLEMKEADSKLTLEDISMLRQIMFDYHRQVRNEMSIPNNEDYCKEVLKRFKAQKGEEV